MGEGGGGVGLCSKCKRTNVMWLQMDARINASMGALRRSMFFPPFSCLLFFFPPIIIWDSFRQNGPSYIYIKCYKNASLLNCYIFRTVNAINFQFSTLHTTPFPYGKIYFGVLHLLRASIATFDTPSGSNPP